jgi:Ca-activated chloride channel family protein
MTSFALAHPWLLALLPLPILVRLFWPPHRESRRGLVVPFLDRLADITGRQPGSGASVAHSGVSRWLMVSLCWTAAVIALARPQLIEPPISRQVPVRDLLLAVDLSGSMETPDFTNANGDTVDRLSAVKEVLDDFLARRQGDRVGLILFGSAAFVQVPFTEDLDVCRELLEEAQVRMAGPQTALGDSLGLAINVFERSTVEERVLIALTDGNDTSSQVPPVKAAEIARDKGIVIHTVAVGDPRAAGEDALDETTLKNVAATTDGLYSHAGNRDELEAIYEQLDKIETRKVDTVSHRPRRDIYWWPLTAALLISMAWFSVGLLGKAGTQHRQARRLSPQSVTAASLGLAPAWLPFHFIRPEWLLALMPAALLWWLLRRRTDSSRAWRGLIAPHLLEQLWGGKEHRSRFGPLAFVGLTWLLTIVAIAGPTWQHEPSPFADDTAALAIVMRVSPSMQTEDIQPSRLERATLKIHDLLKARGDAKTSLIAYSGSAHLVMPPTKDAGIIDNFAQALEPDIMPRDGDAVADALRLADTTLAEAGGGSILWITDSVAPEEAAALAAWRKASASTVRLWPPLLPGDELETLKDSAAPTKPDMVPLAADNSDVRAIAGAAKFADAFGTAQDTRWAENGYWLTPLVALLMLSFFRRGWLVPVARAS